MSDSDESVDIKTVYESVDDEFPSTEDYVSQGKFVDFPKASTWNDVSEIPKLDDMFEGDTSVYDITLKKIDNTTTKATGTYMRNTSNIGNEIEMEAVCYNDSDSTKGTEGTDETCKFVLQSFPKTGVMNCVQLIEDPVLERGPPEEKIKNKIYQYLDIVDIIMWEANKNKTSSVGAGFIFKSNYNGSIVIVCFGTEITLTTECGTNKTEKVITNDYYFGNFANENGKLIKTKGSVLRKLNTQQYQIENIDNIVTIIHPIPDCTYNIMISSKAGVKDMENVLSKTIIGKDVTIVEMKKRVRDMENVLGEVNKIYKKETETKGERDGQCISDKEDACVYVLSREEEISLSKRFDMNVGQPITIYGTDGINKDNINSNTVTTMVIKNQIKGAVNLYNTFGLPEEVMKRIGLLRDGQIIVFITSETKKLQYFMKIRETSNGRPLFIELLPSPSLVNTDIRLSFPELRKTYKLSVADLSVQKMERCNYKILAKPEGIDKLADNYMELKQQYNDLVVGRINIEDVNPFDVKDVKDAITSSDALSELKMQLLKIAISTDDVNQLRDELSEHDTESESESKINIDKEELTSALTAKDYIKVMLLLIGAGVGIHVAGQYLFGMGIGELARAFSEWLYPVNKAIDNVSQTAANIVIDNQNTIAKASAEQIAKMVSDTAKVVVDARPDIALETMKNHVGVIDSIKMVWTKVAEMMNGNTTQGITYIGTGSSSKTLSLSLSGTLNEAQTALLDKLGAIAGGSNLVSANTLFQFTDGDKVVNFMARDLVGGSFNEQGIAIFDQVPKVMETVASGFDEAVKCVSGLATATGMPATSAQCQQQITQAFSTQYQQFAGLGSQMWYEIGGMSMLQITSIVLGVAAISTLAGWLPVGWLVSYFAASAAPGIRASGIGINELINVYETAVQIGSPYVDALKDQILLNPTARAAEFARVMGWPV